MKILIGSAFKATCHPRPIAMAVGHVLTTGGSWAGADTMTDNSTRPGRTGQLWPLPEAQSTGAGVKLLGKYYHYRISFQMVECCKVYEGKAFVSKGKSLGLDVIVGKCKISFEKSEYRCWW